MLTALHSSTVLGDRQDHGVGTRHQDHARSSEQGSTVSRHGVVDDGAGTGQRRQRDSGRPSRCPGSLARSHPADGVHAGRHPDGVGRTQIALLEDSAAAWRSRCVRRHRCGQDYRRRPVNVSASRRPARSSRPRCGSPASTAITYGLPGLAATRESVEATCRTGEESPGTKSARPLTAIPVATRRVCELIHEEIHVHRLAADLVRALIENMKGARDDWASLAMVIDLRGGRISGRTGTPTRPTGRFRRWRRDRRASGPPWRLTSRAPQPGQDRR